MKTYVFNTSTIFDLPPVMPRSLTAAHRDFLLSLVRAEPAWELLPFHHLQRLPALQWKLLNLRKLKSRNPARFAIQHDELASGFEALAAGKRPYRREN